MRKRKIQKVCLCVCVCVRERERGGGGGNNMDFPQKIREIHRDMKSGPLLLNLLPKLMKQTREKQFNKILC